MLRQKGPPPADAARVEGFAPSSKTKPQRDVSQEDDKEDKRGETNRDRKTGGEQSFATQEDILVLREAIITGLLNRPAPSIHVAAPSVQVNPHVDVPPVNVNMEVGVKMDAAGKSKRVEFKRDDKGVLESAVVEEGA